MNWEYLKDNKCPHCGENLRENILEFKCIKCTFVIDSDRKMAIQQHRGNPRIGNIVKIKWQNLKEEKCPICGDNLNYGVGVFEVLVCLNTNCSFKIRHDRFVEILNDPTHPCNRFFERNRTEKYDITE